MRHRKKGNKLSRSKGQRKALLKALLKSIIISERIKTTTPKAKMLKIHIDKMITLAKKDTLAARRQAFDRIGDHSLVKKLFNEIGPRYRNGGGGYCRIYNRGFRKSDGASLAQIELTQIIVKKAKEEKVKEKEGKPAPKKKVGKKEERGKTAEKKGFSGLKKMFKKGKKT